MDNQYKGATVDDLWDAFSKVWYVALDVDILFKYFEAFFVVVYLLPGISLHRFCKIKKLFCLKSFPSMQVN